MQKSIKMKGMHVKSEKSVPTLILQTVLLVVLVAYALSMIIVLGLAFMNSLKLSDTYYYDYFKLPFGEHFAISNYKEIISTMTFEHPYFSGVYVTPMKLIFNSIAYAVGCTLLQATACCLMSYAVARYKNAISKIIYTIVLVVMVIPVVGAMSSEIKMLNNLNLWNTIPGAWALSFNFLGMHFLILHAGFDAIPRDYSEAAQIDGAGHWRIFLQIMMPLAKNALLTIVLLKFIAYWNDYQTPMIYMPAYPTLSYWLYLVKICNNNLVMGNEYLYQITPVHQFSGAMIIFLPIFTLFLFTHKRLMGNVSMGGIKG